jgi:hypothetical protein
MTSKQPKLEVQGGPMGFFIVHNGVRVIERRPVGDRMQWVAIEPGWQVFGGEGEGQFPTKIIGPDGPMTLQ